MLFFPNLIFPCEVMWVSFVPAGTLWSMGISGNLSHQAAHEQKG